MKEDAAGRSQGDRLLHIKAIRQHQHLQPVCVLDNQRPNTARFTSPTTPIKPVSSRGRHLGPPPLAVEENAATRRLDFAAPPGALPRKVARVGEKGESGKSTSSSPVESGPAPSGGPRLQRLPRTRTEETAAAPSAVPANRTAVGRTVSGSQIGQKKGSSLR